MSSCAAFMSAQRALVLRVSCCFSVMWSAINWTASEMILPPFLERRFGEEVPIYTIQSINLFGCLILPPILGALTGGREDFSVILPGTKMAFFRETSIITAVHFTSSLPCKMQCCNCQVSGLWPLHRYSWRSSRMLRVPAYGRCS